MSRGRSSRFAFWTAGLLAIAVFLAFVYAGSLSGGELGPVAFFIALVTIVLPLGLLAAVALAIGTALGLRKRGSGDGARRNRVRGSDDDPWSL